MKILKIRLMNLTSLYGKWEIDLSSPEYISNGLFLITGPTGAGKTTILDAITLALFGQTPRLGRIGRAYNEIMSRGTGECFAEVVFKTGKEEYVAFWGQRRARKRPEGELQPPVHELFTASGRAVELKPSRVKKKIEDITRMDFFRFTRSVLLAQGEFAAFLKAKPGERGPILEQITGTEIYSRISIGVFERMREEENRLALLEEGLKNIQLLSPEGLEQIKADISSVRKRLKEISSRLLYLREVHKQWQDMGKLLEILDRRKEEFGKIGEEINSKMAEFERLEKALGVLPLEVDFQHICSLEREIKEIEKKRDKVTCYLSSLQQKIGEKLDKCRCLSRELSRIEGEKRHLDKIMERVRSLDLLIRTKKAEHCRVVEQKKDIRRELERTCNRLRELDTNKKELVSKVEMLKQRRTCLSLYKGLVTELSGLEEKLSIYRETLESRESLSRELSRIKGELGRLEKTREGLYLRLTGQEKTVEKMRKEVEEKDSIYRTMLEDRNRKNLSQRIKELHHKLALCGFLEESWKKKAELEEKLDTHRHLAQKVDGELKKVIQQKRSLDMEIEEKKRLLDKKIEDKAHLDKVLSLEEERRRLIPGTPCPLCGSREHPYTRGLSPKISVTGEEIENLKEELEILFHKREKLLGEEVALGERLNFYHRDITQCQETIGLLEEKIAKVAKEMDMEKGELCGEGISLLKKKFSREMEVAEEFFNEISTKEKELLSMRERLSRIEEELSLIKEEVLKIEYEISSRDSRKKDMEERLSFFSVKAEEIEREIEKRLVPFGYKRGGGLEEIVSFMKEIRRRCREYVVLEENIKDLTDRLSGMVAEEAAVSEEVEKRKRELCNIEEVEIGLSREIEEWQKEREGLFGTKQPSEEERRIDGLLKEVREEFHRAEKEITSLETEKQEKTIYLRELEEGLDKRREILRKKKEEFLFSLREKGVYSVEEFEKYRLPLEKIEKLRAMREELFSRKRALEAEIGRIEKEIWEKRTGLEEMDAPCVEEVERSLSSCEQEREGLLKEIGEKEHTLKEQERLIETYRRRLKEVEDQGKRVESWRCLSLLIGSADGKKFRSFAQGITFESLLAYANIRLRSMSDRYLLVPDPNEALELRVMDNYYGGEIRSVKNLSGGESFMVSLALALGLSSMTGEQGSIDSMFLDEGFGTLDEGSLDIALGALASLWEEGKLIGVISHLASLKERIFLSLEVVPAGGGRSVIKGPGVKRR